MDESPLQAPPAAPRNKIRLTRAEAYALQLAAPRKKRRTFVAAGMLLVVVLGGFLWHFRDSWLPYWLPETETPESAPDANEPASNQPNDSGVASPTTAPMGSELDFLSAVVWDHPHFQQGIRLFNQALDRYRQWATNPKPGELARQIEDGALQAAVAFNELRDEAPATVPLADYIARCQQLAYTTRELGPPGLVQPVAPSRPATPPRTEVPPYRPGEPWQHPDYLAGAKLFNQALEQYQLFLKDKSRTEFLKPIEELAFQAAKKFEALKSVAPEGVPLGDHITQCYKLISDCRRQHLEGGSAEPANPFDRGTTGPSRRPALPAYQPPQ